MNIAVFIVAALLLTQGTSSLADDTIPGLGKIELPSSAWKLELSYTPKTGAHAYVFKKQATDAERITIVRFEKSQGNRGLTLKDSVGLCDMMGDSLYEGIPSLWGKTPKKMIDRSKTIGPNYGIRLPDKNAIEPLAVTNIYTSPSGNKWMNHGLIASSKEFTFLFVHSSTRVITPDTIENVYFSSKLKRWPQPNETRSRKNNSDKQSTIEIFLVTKQSSEQNRCNESMWNNSLSVFETEKQPIIRDEEILGYDWASHEIILSSSGYQNIPRTISAGGVDFIIKVNGRREYAGTFVTTKSSQSFDWPVVLVNLVPKQKPTENSERSASTFRVPIDQNYHGIGEFDHRNNTNLKQAFANSSRLTD